MRNMRTVIGLGVVLILNFGAQAAVLDSEFHTKQWGADGIAIGRVISVDKTTIEFEIEEWMRDRTDERAGRIRTYGYSEPTCFPEREHYEVGWRYLLLMLRPYYPGGGDLPDWSIIVQLPLKDSRFCLSLSPFFRLEKLRSNCDQFIGADQVLDALRTFDRCFEFQSTATGDVYPSKIVCSEKEIAVWGERSNLHAMLVKKATSQLRKKPQGGL